MVCEAVTSGQTKGVGQTTSSSLQASDIGLSAWREDDGTSFTGTELDLSNRRFSYDSDSETWKGNTYWSFGNWLSFFAYAPYMADVSSGMLQFPSSDYVSGYPRLQFTPAALASQQVDLCLATPVIDRSYTEGTVPLNFSHVLTRVCLQARWTGSQVQCEAIAAEEKTIRLISLSYQNVVSTNKLSYGRTSFIWDTPEDYNGTYTMSVTNGCLQSTSLPSGDSYSTSFWNMDDACLYLLPQELTEESQLQFTYGIFNSDGSLDSQDTVALNIGTLTQHIWAAGVEITYSLTVDLNGGNVVEVDITYDCNAGTYVAPGSIQYDETTPGSFLGGEFELVTSNAGNYSSGTVVGNGSSAGTFTE